METAQKYGKIEVVASRSITRVVMVSLKRAKVGRSIHLARLGGNSDWVGAERDASPFAALRHRVGRG